MRVRWWVLVGLLTIACVHQTPEEIIPSCSAANAPGFKNDIKPIMGTHCSYAGCHDGSSGNIPSLVTLEEVESNAPDIYFQLTRDAMPPVGSSPLSAREKAVILCWINQGAKAP